MLQDQQLKLKVYFLNLQLITMSLANLTLTFGSTIKFVISFFFNKKCQDIITPPPLVHLNPGYSNT